MSDRIETANENRIVLKRADPDAAYVEDYIDKMLVHFNACHIHFELVSRTLIGKLVRHLPGDPYDKSPDESDLHAGLSCLVPAAGIFERRTKAYNKALNRLQLDRMQRLADELGCDLEQAVEVWKERTFGADPAAEEGLTTADTD